MSEKERFDTYTVEREGAAGELLLVVDMSQLFTICILQ